jgi:hypothetical protein
VFEGYSPTPKVTPRSLESQLNVQGVSAATHDSVIGTIDFAISKFLQAVEDGDVATISPQYTESGQNFT